MSDETMPVTEVTSDAIEPELSSYEIAFHILPTATEGEVTQTMEAIKGYITEQKGVVTTEEAPQRIELAYEINKYLEGRHRSFGSAYFGWVRCTVAPAAVASIVEQLDSHKQLLRYLFVSLSKAEEQYPFYYHEAMNTKQITTIDAEIDGEVESEETVDVLEAEAAPVEEDGK